MRRRLAGAGRADPDHELSIGDREVHVRDRLYAVGVALGHVFETTLAALALFCAQHVARAGCAGGRQGAACGGPDFSSVCG
jgi:hypothetical protein